MGFCEPKEEEGVMKIYFLFYSGENSCWASHISNRINKIADKLY